MILVFSCGACEPECPVNAITAGDDKYKDDAATCIDCGACVFVQLTLLNQSNIVT